MPRNWSSEKFHTFLQRFAIERETLLITKRNVFPSIYTLHHVLVASFSVSLKSSLIRGSPCFKGVSRVSTPPQGPIMTLHAKNSISLNLYLLQMGTYGLNTSSYLVDTSLFIVGILATSCGLIGQSTTTFGVMWTKHYYFGSTSRFIPTCFGSILGLYRAFFAMGHVTLNSWECGQNTIFYGFIHLYFNNS